MAFRDVQGSNLDLRHWREVPSAVNNHQNTHPCAHIHTFHE